mgnify:FL=1|tara:strand:- start:1120 stop:1332 length:213 start_codon:yes stop_codon:yes gene_type:complete
MVTIDLHGVRYRDVYGKLEKHCVNGEIPFVVITGESSTMKDIVSQIAQQFGLFIEDKLGNDGRIIVYEGR